MPTLRTNDIETRYLDRGDGPPVVFIHGAKSTRAAWQFQIEALQDEYRTIAYDVRDHGATDPSPSNYGIDQLVDDLHQLIEGLGLDTPVVCGHSMGGFVAQRHAVTYPDDAVGHVFADTWTPGHFSKCEYFLMNLVPRLYVKGIDAVGYERVSQALAVLHSLLITKDGHSEEESVEVTGNDSDKFTAERLSRISRVTVQWLQSSIDLTEVSNPVLFLYGENELDYMHAHVGRMAADIDDFRAHEIPDVGHHPHQENPEVFTEHLETFLAENAE